jgi:multimeric flavodoxin WrbA
VLSISKIVHFTVIEKQLLYSDRFRTGKVKGMKIIGINGSPRRDGNTAKMLHAVLDILRTGGVEAEYIQLGGREIRGCTACYQCRNRKDRKCAVNGDCFNEIFAEMLASDGFILGSPTYFTDVTSEMKALIDRAGFVARSNDHLFRYKVGAAVVALRRGGGLHAFDTINHLFQISSMFIVGSTYWNIGFGGGRGDVKDDTEAFDTMTALGSSMLYLLQKLET